jgi:hypothetical protein
MEDGKMSMGTQGRKENMRKENKTTHVPFCHFPFFMFGGFDGAGGTIAAPAHHSFDDGRTIV